MGKRYTKESFAESIDRRLSGFQADPWLARRVTAADEGGKPVKKLSLGMILAIVLLCILITGAVAAATQGLTIGDIWKWAVEKGETKLPENYEETVFDEIIPEEEIIVEDEHAVYRIPGYYCDGKTLSVVVNISPKEDFLPVWDLEDEDMNTPVRESYYRTSITDEITVAEYARKYHQGNVAAFEFVEAEDEDRDYVFGGCSEGQILNADGSLSIIQDMNFSGPLLAEGSVQMQIRCKKGTITGDASGWHVDRLEEDTIMVPMTLHVTETRKYICKEGFDVPDVGLRVREARMEVSPIQIWCELDFTVTDAELYGAQWIEVEVTETTRIGDRLYESQTTGKTDSLGFEFVYPDGNTVPVGPAGTISGTGDGDFSEPRKNQTFHLAFPISRDAFDDRYAMRAYNKQTGERFGIVEFTVEPAGE
jgi:hypothetical protein